MRGPSTVSGYSAWGSCTGKMNPPEHLALNVSGACFGASQRVTENSLLKSTHSVSHTLRLKAEVVIRKKPELDTPPGLGGPPAEPPSWRGRRELELTLGTQTLWQAFWGTHSITKTLELASTILEFF